MSPHGDTLKALLANAWHDGADNGDIRLAAAFEQGGVDVVPVEQLVELGPVTLSQARRSGDIAFR